VNFHFHAWWAWLTTAMILWLAQSIFPFEYEQSDLGSRVRLLMIAAAAVATGIAGILFVISVWP